jgi:hypothetical protein
MLEGTSLRTPSALVCAALLALAAPARAGEAERTQAEQLFQKAVALVSAGKQVEACPLLEESDKLDPQPGVEYELAKCYEVTQRTASAWTRYLEVAGKLDARGEGAKAEKIRKRVAAEVEPKLIRLSILVPDAVAAIPGLAITRDGMPVGRVAWGTPVPVDPGPHVVRAVAEGRDSWEETRRLDTPGALVVVQVPALTATLAAPAPPPLTALPPAVPPPRGWPAQRTGALVAGALGVVSLAVGAGLGAAALGKDATWKDKTSTLCDASLACPVGEIAGLQALERARAGLAHGSTAALIAGGVGVAAGLTLWLTAPASAPRTGLRLAPLLGAGSAGVTIGGVL